MIDLSSFNVDLAKAAAVVAVLLGIGKLLKVTPVLPNAYIPFALFLIGIVAYPVATELYTGGAFFAGAACGLSAVGAHQNVVQAREVVKPQDPPQPSP